MLTQEELLLILLAIIRLNNTDGFYNIPCFQMYLSYMNIQPSNGGTFHRNYNFMKFGYYFFKSTYDIYYDWVYFDKVREISVNFYFGTHVQRNV